MNSERIFRNAMEADKETILALYRELLDVQGCTWTEDYPAMEEIDRDVENDALCVLCEADGSIISAIARDVDDEELESQDWRDDFKKPAYLSRLGVRRSENNKGIARETINRMFDKLRQDGFDGVRILVSPNNTRAVHLYGTLGFKTASETDLFDQHWFCQTVRL